jgi:hypothetical protein
MADAPCHFCRESAIEQTFTELPVCQEHLNKILAKVGELIDRMEFTSSVMDDLEAI